MKILPARIVVYPKDVENITGRRERSARKLLQNIRQALGKQPHEFITVQEFSAFTGIKEDLIRDYLKH